MQQQQDKEASEALTGGILHTDGVDTQEQSVPRLNRQSIAAIQKIAVFIFLLGLLGAVVGLAIGFSRSRAAAAAGIDPACVHALGGGSVRSGGGMDSTAAPDYCKAQLQQYGRRNSGRYWREVSIAMAAAMSTLPAHVGVDHQSSHVQLSHQQKGSQHHAGLQLQTDPTDGLSLSRSLLFIQPQRAQQQAQQAQQQAAGIGAGKLLGGPVAAAAIEGDAQQLRQLPVPSRDKVVVFDIDETVLSNMEQILDPETWPWDKWVAAASAPALAPSLEFYQALCTAGYSVAFVTGRKEASRNSTMHNLETAGYGKPCHPGPGPFYGVQDPPSRTGSECCYSALYLRQPGDARLASVYKPHARKDLLEVGNMTLVALVGDQFSDLNGEQAAPFAFKLPNPFYYIL